MKILRITSPCTALPDLWIPTNVLQAIQNARNHAWSNKLPLNFGSTLQVQGTQPLDAIWKSAMPTRKQKARYTKYGQFVGSLRPYRAVNRNINNSFIQISDTIKIIRYTDKLQARRSGILSPVGTRFSALVQTGHAAHPVSCTMGTGSLGQGQSGRSVALTTHPHLAPRLKKRVAPYLHFPLCLHGML